MVDFDGILKNAKTASKELLLLSEKKVNEVLVRAAIYLARDKEQIKAENQKDIENAVKKGLTPAFIDRLTLTDKVIAGIAQGIVEVSKLKSPYDKVVYKYKNRKQGITVLKKTVPFGVVGMIFESRPNVGADAFALCFKSRNAVVLRGGSDAINSNRQIVKTLRLALMDSGVNPDAVSFIDDGTRESANQFIARSELDLLIPRGGAKLIDAVVKGATVPVIQTGKGNCHVFIDESANIDMAVKVIVNAKTQRTSVCNACESLVLHSAISKENICKIADALIEKKVELRCDNASYEILKNKENVILATEEDYFTEYNDLIISVNMVDSIDQAIVHVNAHSSGHSEAIITENKENADKFKTLVDSACVYHNASTRFSDGFVFGLGAEIGISTQKLHARGPMGLDGLTTTKYFIKAKGAVRK